MAKYTTIGIGKIVLIIEPFKKFKTPDGRYYYDNASPYPVKVTIEKLDELGKMMLSRT